MSDEAVLNLLKSRFDSTDRRLAALDTKTTNLAKHVGQIDVKVGIMGKALAIQAEAVPRINLIWVVGKWIGVVVGGIVVVAVGAGVIYWADWK